MPAIQKVSHIAIQIRLIKHITSIVSNINTGYSHYHILAKELINRIPGCIILCSIYESEKK